MTARWRVDYLRTPHAMPETTWHADEAAAIAEETRLVLSGCSRVVAWLDGPIEETR